MHISIQRDDFLDIPCDLLVVSALEGSASFGDAVKRVDEMMDGALVDLLKRDGFQGKRGERVVFPAFGMLKARKVAVLGLGDRKGFSEDHLRLAGGHIIKIAREAKAKKVVTVLHGVGVAGLDAEDAAQAVGEGLQLAAYRFHAYRSAGSKDAQKDIQEIVLVETNKTIIKSVTIGLERARVLSEATILARELVNTPSQDMAPAQLAEAARALVTRGSGIRCTVLDKQKMEKMGMGAALAVAAGSQHAPIGIHLVYTPPKRAKKRVAIVGKAVTFDSGGLNIKPGDGMTTMKIDMAGAATVIGLFKALPALKIPVEVHGIFLAVENMPSGSAYRPGDVVKAMNGMTIEILNTDAEGRVTLADALSYAVKKVKPDAMVDLATLTGAAIIALGDDITPLMGNDKTLVKGLLAASKYAGEEMWELPLYAPYDEAVNSKIADMNNTGGRAAGTIKGGLFLQRFVADTPWAHLDIAGPSYCERETRPDVPLGGTGVGVRTLVRWLEQLN